MTSQSQKTLVLESGVDKRYCQIFIGNTSHDIAVYTDKQGRHCFFRAWHTPRNTTAMTEYCASIEEAAVYAAVHIIRVLEE